MTIKELGIDRLDTEQQIALALEIWENLGEKRPEGTLTPEQRQELRRRDRDLDAQPRIALTWEQIRSNIETRNS
jgi:putative addiction module component (TIGR02574 family)